MGYAEKIWGGIKIWTLNLRKFQGFFGLSPVENKVKTPDFDHNSFFIFAVIRGICEIQVHKNADIVLKFL